MSRSSPSPLANGGIAFVVTGMIVGFIVIKFEPISKFMAHDPAATVIISCAVIAVGLILIIGLTEHAPFNKRDVVAKKRRTGGNRTLLDVNRDAYDRAHWWSGWPHARCLKCNATDPYEEGLINGVFDPISGWASDKQERDAKLRLICPVDDEDAFIAGDVPHIRR